MSRRKRLSLLRSVGLGLAIGLILNVWLFWNRLGKPVGADIPKELPGPADRLMHPDGFSLVFPRHWQVHFLDEPAALNGWPRRPLPARWAAALYVGRVPNWETLDLSSARPIEFQGQPAFEVMHTRPGAWPDEPPVFSYSLLCQRENGRWYRLGYTVGRDLTTLPPMIRAYFGTFRVDGPTGEPSGRATGSAASEGAREVPRGAATSR